LIYIIAVVGAGLATNWLHSVPWLSFFGIALTLFLPGYVLSLLLFPVLAIEERLLISLGLSIVITGLSGLILNVTALGLNSITWGLWLAAFTLVGAGWVWLRREAHAGDHGPSWPALAWPKKLPWRSLALAGFSLACVLLAFNLSNIFSNRLDTPLTALWAAYDPANARRLNIGVRNQEGRPMTYDLVIETAAREILQRQSVQVEDEKTFWLAIDFQQASQPLVRVLLFNPDLPNQPYREVTAAQLNGALQAQGGSR
jgi:uncharacterized membrane protein